MALRISQTGKYASLAWLVVRHGSNLRPDSDVDTAAMDPDAEKDAQELASALEDMGPTFIKLGQLLSTRSDLLPPTHLKALSRLQDEVEPFPSDLATELFEREIGVGVKTAFATFDADPIASASLGQVYRATMRDGRAVVVKVQRPDIEQQVHDDLETLGDIAALIDAHTDAGRRYGFADMFDQFRRSLTQELDYEREATNLIRLAAELEGHELLVVPRPVADFSSRRILTMDEIPGRKVTDVSGLARLDLDGPALASALFSAYLDQIFLHGFFHADPHPGNVLITPDGRIGLVDLGMVGHLNAGLRSELVKLLFALADGRGDEVARILCSLGQPLEDFEQAQVVRRVAALVDENHGQTLADVRVGQLMTELSRECAIGGLRPPPELTMLARALLNLDSIAKHLAPDFDPRSAILSNADRLLKSQIGTSPSHLVNALVDARDFTEQLPGRAGRLMDALASGEFKVNVQAFDEAELLRGLQKLANRVTMGLVIAALVLGASIMSRSYPTVALGCFIGAGVCAIVLIGSILLADRHVNARTKRRRTL